MTPDNEEIDPSDTIQFPAMARQTCVRANLMTGWAPTTRRATEDFEQLVRVLERWPDTLTSTADTRCQEVSPYTMLPLNATFKALRFDGAIFAGFSAVFRDDPQLISTELPIPSFEWRYDVAMANPLFQPPGAPRYITGVQDRWVDTR